MPLSCSIISDAHELEALAPSWSELVARSATNELTLTPIWLIAWWRTFGRLGRRRLRFMCCHDGRRLVGIAPFLTRTHWYRPAIPFRRMELLGSGEDEADEICSEYLNVLAERGFER